MIQFVILFYVETNHRGGNVAVDAAEGPGGDAGGDGSEGRLRIGQHSVSDTKSGRSLGGHSQKMTIK